MGDLDYTLDEWGALALSNKNEERILIYEKKIISSHYWLPAFGI